MGFTLMLVLAVAVFCAVAWTLRDDVEGAALPLRRRAGGLVPPLRPGVALRGGREPSGPARVVDRSGALSYAPIARHIAEEHGRGEQALVLSKQVLQRSSDYALLVGSDILESVRPHVEAIIAEAQAIRRHAAQDRAVGSARAVPAIGLPRIIEDPMLIGQVHYVPLSEGNARESELAAQRENEQREVARRREAQPRLVRVEGDGPEALPFSHGGTSVGRADHHGEGQLAVRLASRNHARLGIDNRGSWIVDLASKHGTLVNGEAIGSERVYLNAGDTVELSPGTVYRFASGSIAHYDTPDA